MTRLTDEEFVYLWRCGDRSHGECWSSSHLTTEQLRTDGIACIGRQGEPCSCWRCRILALHELGMKYRHLRIVRAPE